MESHKSTRKRSIVPTVSRGIQPLSYPETDESTKSTPRNCRPWATFEVVLAHVNMEQERGGSNFAKARRHAYACREFY